MNNPVQNILSVSDINSYLKGIISRDIILSNVRVNGEISNYKHHSSGHIYFTLKDKKSILKCVMFRSQAIHLRFALENGMSVIARGYISVYERDGQYQLYVEELQPDGVGDLHFAFEQLKKKLGDEGLFKPEKKKKIPFIPKSIGVVTSITGSVIKDIINVISRRFENVQLKVVPVQVQGETAAGQIASAIKKLNETGDIDVIIIARGGGSLEELWAFNEEVVARSIFDSKIPVISAIGHQTDYTISDFVADVRAPTPSAAAEIVVPEKRLLENKIANLKTRLGSSLLRNIGLSRLRLQRLMTGYVFKQPYSRINSERQRLDIIYKDMCKAVLQKEETARAAVSLLIEKLNAFSPLGVLSRGYGIVRSKKDNCSLRSVEEIACGDIIELTISDGVIDCTVDRVRKCGNAAVGGK